MIQRKALQCSLSLLALCAVAVASAAAAPTVAADGGPESLISLELGAINGGDSTFSLTENGNQTPGSSAQ